MRASPGVWWRSNCASSWVAHGPAFYSQFVISQNSVIPSKARNLLFACSGRKADSSLLAALACRNDKTYTVLPDDEFGSVRRRSDALPLSA
jgi:hypothetical protein